MLEPFAQHRCVQLIFSINRLFLLSCGQCNKSIEIAKTIWIGQHSYTLRIHMTYGRPRTPRHTTNTMAEKRRTEWMNENPNHALWNAGYSTYTHAQCRHLDVGCSRERQSGRNSSIKLIYLLISHHFHSCAIWNLCIGNFRHIFEMSLYMCAMICGITRVKLPKDAGE